MRTLVILSTTLALAACNQKTETVVEPAATETAAMQTPSPASNQAATGAMAGKYEMKMADGTMATETINPDGTFTMVSGGKETRGKWRMDGAKSCFDPDGDAAEVCYTSTAPAADGSFVATGPDGSTMTVRKVGAASPM